MSSAIELPEAWQRETADAFNTVEITDDHALRLHALAVPGAYWAKDRKHYVVHNPTSRAARAILRMFPERVIDYPWLVERAEEDYGADDARPYPFAQECGIEIDVGEFADGKHLYNWQDIDSGFLHAMIADKAPERASVTGAFVNWEPGLGKTVSTAAFLRKFRWQRSLVVCRNDAKVSVWERQLGELLGNTHELRILPNAAGPRGKMLREIGTWPTYAKPLVFIIHYEALTVVADGGGGQNSKGGMGKGWDKLGKWDALVYDEGHRLSTMNPNAPQKNAQKHKALMHLRRKHVDVALNLTGSGIQNHEEDLFGQLHFIQPNTYKAKWADWNDPYLDFVKVGKQSICIGFKAEKLPQLRKELGVFTVYRKKREVFPDLPKPIVVDRYLDLLPSQRAAYNEMRDAYWAEIEGGLAIQASSPVARLTRLRQLATYWPGLDSIKLNTAIGEMEDLPDEQFVVFTWFKEPGHALADRYGESVVVVDGDVNPRHRPELLRRHERGLARILVGSIATLGESLNLQYCNEAIRLDRDWNPQTNQQTLDRLDRDGQQNLVTLRDLWAADTVDTLRVFPRLVGKESLRRALYG